MSLKETTTLILKSCIHCPFASTYLNGYVQSRLHSHAKRLYLKCNVQNLGPQYNAARTNYKCFETCPLKENNFKIVLDEK